MTAVGYCWASPESGVVVSDSAASGDGSIRSAANPLAMSPFQPLRHPTKIIRSPLLLSDLLNDQTPLYYRFSNPF